MENSEFKKNRTFIRFRRCSNLLCFLCIAAFFMVSCGKKGDGPRDEYRTPSLTYKEWIKAGSEGDIYGSTEAITEVSRKMMDQLERNRDEFVRRMVASSAAFKNYSIGEERITGNRAMVMIESPDKKARIVIPLALEKGEWKVDLIKMFGG